MSKLLMAFVHCDDADAVKDALRSAGHRFTLMPSIGGFLESEDATFVPGVEDRVRVEIVAIFERTCRGREVEVPLVLMERLQGWQAKSVHLARRGDHPHRRARAHRPDLGGRGPTTSQRRDPA
jgi:uncharacterized protein YaaQ